MKKFILTMNELNYLQEVEIQASSQEEAKDKYRKMWENGEILSNDSELILIECVEVK